MKYNSSDKGLVFMDKITKNALGGANFTNGAGCCASIGLKVMKNLTI